MKALIRANISKGQPYNELMIQNTSRGTRIVPSYLILKSPFLSNSEYRYRVYTKGKLRIFASPLLALDYLMEYEKDINLNVYK